MSGAAGERQNERGAENCILEGGCPLGLHRRQIADRAGLLNGRGTLGTSLVGRLTSHKGHKGTLTMHVSVSTTHCDLGHPCAQVATNGNTCQFANIKRATLRVRKIVERNNALYYDADASAW